ncbi:MAG: tagaturonate reductase [Bacteroidota bacterium]
MLKKLSRDIPPLPVKALQFGGGNFQRAFTDWILDVYNQKLNQELGVLVVRTHGKKTYQEWIDQEGLYHILTRGLKKGEIIDEQHQVSCISQILHTDTEWEDFIASAENPDIRLIISNTTEAGITYSPEDKLTGAPPEEFPAKLTSWLFHRFQHFEGQTDKGCIFMPLELISENGIRLRECILQNADNWGIEEAFKEWIRNHNIFCNTLVDRIVPGIKKEDLPKEMVKVGFEDNMMTVGEAFHFWAIEGPNQVEKEFPFNQLGLNVIFTQDLAPYRKRKVRLLNGAHTSMVPVGILYGFESVREAVEDEVMGSFVKHCLFQEIIPSLDMPAHELAEYAEEILDRFRNPFIHHRLISISLNSISKFNTRVLPSILDYKHKKGELPKGLVFAMAALIHFYKGEHEGRHIPLNDDEEAITFLQHLWQQCDGSEFAFSDMAQAILRWEYTWKQDLSTISSLGELLQEYLGQIERDGMKKALDDLLQSL